MTHDDELRAAIVKLGSDVLQIKNAIVDGLGIGVVDCYIADKPIYLDQETHDIRTRQLDDLLAFQNTLVQAVDLPDSVTDETITAWFVNRLKYAEVVISGELATEFRRRLVMMRKQNETLMGIDLVAAFYPWINDQGDKIVAALSAASLDSADGTSREAPMTCEEIRPASEALQAAREALIKIRKGCSLECGCLPCTGDCMTNPALRNIIAEIENEAEIALALVDSRRVLNEALSEIDTAFIRESINSGLRVQWKGSDILPFCGEIDRLRAEVQGRDVDLECRGKTIDELSRRFEEKIATARAAALEEAAKIADKSAALVASQSADYASTSMIIVAKTIAADIRALASGGGEKG